MDEAQAEIVSKLEPRVGMKAGIEYFGVTIQVRVNEKRDHRGLSLLARSLTHRGLESGGPFFYGNRLVDLVGETAGPLCLNALADPFFDPAVLFRKLVVVFLHIVEDGVKLFSIQAGKSPLDEVKVLTAMKVIKNV